MSITNTSITFSDEPLIGETVVRRKCFFTCYIFVVLNYGVNNGYRGWQWSPLEHNAGGEFVVFYSLMVLFTVL